jgi:ectoine hydroxylase-related dioxygenase (phytanoyl-CoA dioxygenase family)
MAEPVTHVAADAPTAEIMKAMNESGAVIVEGLLDTDTIARFNAELDAPLDEADSGRVLVNPLIEWFMGKETRHLTAVAARSRVFVDEVLCHPVLLGLCDEILLPSCARYQLNIAHVLDRGPGSEQQLLHRDELVWCHVPRPHSELQVASVIALGDFTAENGATRLVPGSHRWPLERQPEPDEIVAAEMPAGSAVVYLGSTIHGGGPNTTKDQRRRGMHVSYTLGWLRTEENHYLTATPEVVRDFPRQAQELLGYAVHDALALGGGYLGAVDTADPVELMAQGKL